MPHDSLTDDEMRTNAETMRHILSVRTLLAECVLELVSRGDAHDKSKLGPPEVAAFTTHTEKLRGVEYGSAAYRELLREIKPALDHHYANNRHHPEFHKDGILGMDLFDLLEMLADWAASGLRGEDGSLAKSLEINRDRFKIPPALERVLLNTAPVIERMAERANVAASYPQVGEESGG